MRRIFKLQSFLFFAACSLAGGAAVAAEDHSSFEQGLHNSWSAQAAHSGFGQGKEHGFNALRDDDRFAQHSPERHSFAAGEGWHHGHGFDIRVSPVPEPRQDAMVFTGMALLAAWVLRRRRAPGAAH